MPISYRAVAASLLIAACHHATLPAAPPPLVIGEFLDDYGGHHTVSATTWFQGTRTRYNIVRWVPEASYFIAQNDSANRDVPGKWTRIDWLALPNMTPYEWAFCFSAYDAPSRAIAETVSVAHRDAPRTGCNGYPFSRMKRAP